MMDVLKQDREIWDLFTRKEEYETQNRDRYDRFPYYRSRHRDVLEPRASQMLMERGYHCDYPESQPFAICLTHDIDRIYKPFFDKCIEIVHWFKNGDPLRAARCIPPLHSKRIPWCNFREIAALEESYGAHSSLFFLAIEEGEMGYAYDIRDLEQEICTLRDRGWDIGLHGGCEAYRDPERLKRERRSLEKVLNRSVVGYRNHFLRFQVPETWDLLEKEGFLYDTTVGYTDCAGFRNGMCHPFRPFNLHTNSEMEILEIPLAVMDRTLLSGMRLSTTQAWDLTKQLIDTVERLHGVITILWHNEYMVGEPLRIYEKILHYGAEKGAWLASCSEIGAWWKKNGMYRSMTP